MNINQILIILICQIAVFASAKTYLIIDDMYKDCAKDGERWDLYDLSNLELILYNDTHTFFNGSILIKKPIESPWHLHSYSEHYEHGKWFKQAFNNDCHDFCKQFHDPTKPWYYVTKDRKGCPVPAGHIWYLDMIPVEIPEVFLMFLPTHYMGNWRLIMDFKFNDSGKILHDCTIGYGEIYMDSLATTPVNKSSNGKS